MEAVNGALAVTIRHEMSMQSTSVARLAERSGIPERTLRALLSGRQSVNAHQLVTIGEALGLSGAELLARAESRL